MDGQVSHSLSVDLPLMEVWGFSEFLEWYLPDVTCWRTSYLEGSRASGRAVDVCFRSGEYLDALSVCESSAVLTAPPLIRLWTIHWLSGDARSRSGDALDVSIHLRVKPGPKEGQTAIECLLFPRNSTVKENPSIVQLLGDSFASALCNNLRDLATGTRNPEFSESPLDHVVNVAVDHGSMVLGENRWREVGSHYEPTNECRLDRLPGDLAEMGLVLPHWIAQGGKSLDDTLWQPGDQIRIGD